MPDMPVSNEEEEQRSWREVLASMLPPGMPLPDQQDRLDYSFATEYQGPPPSYPVPIAKPVEAPSSSSPKQEVLPENLKNLSPDSPDSAASSSSAASKLSFSDQEDPHMSPPISDSPSFASFPIEGRLFGSKIDTLRYQEDNDASSLHSAFSFHAQNSSTMLPSAAGNGYAGTSYADTKTQDAVPSQQQRKKGGCYRCYKGHRFQEKETCLVCGSKYCSNCVLIAMGSMPEGRKCVKCIGQPIDEARRPCLGKPSRLLNRILSPLEVQQIMKAERECPANQLRPEQLFVNGRQLRPEEMAELLGCSNPPVKLKPGKYWYDKQSGLWGKEGEKPDRIITADLNVGGQLPEDASNGNTKIFINGREITKTEMKMLKFAGVQCPPGTHLWVYPDGNYQEEGQNNIRGNIWGKATIKFLYPFFSLPTPRSSSNGSRVDVNNVSARSVPGYLEQKRTHKLLLLGLEGSGTSTIYKQAKILYKDENNDESFTKDELQSMKSVIQSNIIKYLIILLEGRERFDEEEEARLRRTCESGEPEGKNIYSINARLKQNADWFLEIMANGDLEAFFPAATREYAPVVDEMWKNPAVQATFQRKAELHMLPDVAEYFLERVIEVSTNEYVPSENDILFAEGVTQGTGLAEVEFTLDEKSPISEPYNENYDLLSPNVRFQLIRVSSKGMNDSCKWLEMFEDVRAIIFCVAISEYDQMWMDGDNVLRNKMLLSRELLETILRHPCFRDTPVILLLNKYDLFEEKIRSVPLTTCEWFSDFDPVRASHYSAQTLAQQAYTYIAHKFKKLFESINTTGRKLYTYQLRALDRFTVAAAFHYVREILKWEETKASTTCWILSEDSTYSEYSSASPLANEGVHP